MVEGPKVEIAIKSPEEVKGPRLSWTILLKKSAPEKLFEGECRLIEQGDEVHVNVDLARLYHLRGGAIRNNLAPEAKRKKLRIHVLGPNGEVIASGSDIERLRKEVNEASAKMRRGE